MNTAEDMTNAIATARACLARIVELHKDATKAEDDDSWDGWEKAQEYAQEMSYGVKVRTGWFDPWKGVTLPDDLAEGYITVAGGGPAARVWFELDGHGEACQVKLQCQDWFTPWVDVTTSSDEWSAMEWFVNSFNFRELY